MSQLELLCVQNKIKDILRDKNELAARLEALNQGDTNAEIKVCYVCDSFSCVYKSLDGLLRYSKTRYKRFAVSFWITKN